MKTQAHSSIGIFAGLAVIASACATGVGGDVGSAGSTGTPSHSGGAPANGSRGGAGSSGNGASLSGSGGTSVGSSGGATASGSSGASAGTAGQSSSGTASGAASGDDAGGAEAPDDTDGSTTAACPGQTLPALSDYSMNGPFATTTMDGTGPGGKYTVFQPTTLGQNGFKHPVAMWGNGITTTPQIYPGLLGAVASNGFVVIASDSTSVTAQNMTDGLDWMIAQNAASGPYQGKLDTTCLVSIGYSLGGGAAVTAGSHKDVKAVVSFHGVTGNSAALHSPLLLFTSTKDTFVTASGFVTPTFNASTVQTFYATLTGAGDNGHLTPILDAGPERAPAIAWLRLWVYGDQGARKYFYGSDCVLCKDPWGMPQTKNWH